MTDKLAYFNLKETSFDMDECTIIRNISAQIVDMRDDAIVEACVDFAKQAGIHDLILLDKKFVLDALREKIQGKTVDAVPVVRCKDCGWRKKNTFCLRHGHYVKDDFFCADGGDPDDDRGQ